jgi:hypothetical protein
LECRKQLPANCYLKPKEWGWFTLSN